MGLNPPQFVKVDPATRRVTVSGETGAELYWAGASVSATRPVPGGAWVESIAPTKGTRLADGTIDLGHLKGLKNDVAYAVHVGCSDRRGGKKKNEKRVSGKSATVEVPPMHVYVAKPATPAPIDPPDIEVGETPPIPIVSLDAPMEAYKHYRLVDGDYSLSGTRAIRTPGVRLSLGNAHVRSGFAGQYASLFLIAAPMVTLADGHHHPAVRQSVVSIDPALGTDATVRDTILEPIRDAGGTIVPLTYQLGADGNLTNQIVPTQPYGLCKFDNVIRPKFLRNRADAIQDYLLYANGGGVDVLIEGNHVGTSHQETPVRLHGVTGNLIVRGNYFRRGLKGSFRFHDSGLGSVNALIENNTFYGDKLYGPLAEMQGGQAIGISEWYRPDRNNNPAGCAYADRDEAFTFAYRAATLGLRIRGSITDLNNTLIGAFNVRAGVEPRIQVTGGTSTPLPMYAADTGLFGQPIIGVKDNYPEPAWRLSGDVMRPPSMADFFDHAFSGSRASLNWISGWTKTRCTYNGVAA